MTKDFNLRTINQSTIIAQCIVSNNVQKVVVVMFLENNEMSHRLVNFYLVEIVEKFTKKNYVKFVVIKRGRAHLQNIVFAYFGLE